MKGQVNYYNHFGDRCKESILSCPEPELWTTDYSGKGRIYQEIKHRIEQQQQLILTYFDKNIPVLDIGCGFGRQAVLLAKNGFDVTGIDTSDVFITIAQRLFEKHNFKGTFFCADPVTGTITGKFKQLLLLDVLEHIKPLNRRLFIKKLHEISEPGGILIISLPHVKKRMTSMFNNNVRRKITQHFSFFLRREEHPYPVPAKKDILKRMSGYFTLKKFIESALTDYYVLQRI
jgi:2-polyprenyl-3-methyl-5-hydroxy-6-metoxy-1,4-benzoquinol methylase